MDENGIAQVSLVAKYSKCKRVEWILRNRPTAWLKRNRIFETDHKRNHHTDKRQHFTVSKGNGKTMSETGGEKQNTTIEQVNPYRTNVENRVSS